MSVKLKLNLFLFFSYCLPLFFTTHIHAEENKTSFAGFASFIYAKSLDDKGIFTDISDKGEYRDFNILGLRMDSQLQNNLSFAAQMTAAGDTDYKPEFEWIYLQYKLMKYLDVRIGRGRVPLFMYSDYLDVGYAYPWIKPPRPVYEDAVFRTFEGVSLHYNHPIGMVSSNIIIYAGKTEEDFNLPLFETKLDLKKMHGFAWTLEYDVFTLRMSYNTSLSSGDLTTIDSVAPALELLQTVEQITNGDFMDDILWEEDNPYFAGIGFAIDYGSFFIISEVTQVRNSSSIIVGDVSSHYLTAGIRPIKKWTFSLTYGHDDDKFKKEALTKYDQAVNQYIAATGTNATDDFFDLLGSGIPDIDELQTIKTDILNNVAYATYNDDTTYMLDVRWDFHPKAAITFEYLTKEDNYFTGGKKSSDAFRLALDLVF